MTGSEYAYRLEPARGSDAERLAAMSRAHVEAGLKPAWGAARIRWHVRDAESVVLTARLPAHRRRGIARALVRWLEETALTAGTFVIGLELRAGNEGARALYRALGYRELGQIPGYYQGVESAIRMARDVRARRESAPGTREQTP